MDTRARERLAAELARELHAAVDLILVPDAPEEHLELTLHHVRRLRKRLEEAGAAATLWGVASTPEGARGMLVLGRANPPPAIPRASDLADTVEAVVVFDETHRGPDDDTVHGGYVAYLFDELCGRVQSLTGSRPGLTKRLDVTYHRRAPLGRPVHFMCRVLAVDGPDITVHGQALDGETLLTEATAVFRQRRLPE